MESILTLEEEKLKLFLSIGKVNIFHQLKDGIRIRKEPDKISYPEVNIKGQNSFTFRYAWLYFVMIVLVNYQLLFENV